MVIMMISSLALKKKKSMQIATFFIYYCCYLHREEGYHIEKFIGCKEKEAQKKWILNKEEVIFI